MAAHGDYFDPVCRSLICAGEQGGRLDVMLERLATLIRQQVKVRKTVQGAMIYPALLSCIAVVVVAAMLGFVLPRFEGLFKSLDTPLPTTTRWLMSASNILRGYWWAFLAVAAALVTALRLWAATPAGRLRLDRLAVTAPQLGNLTRSFATARIARMLGTLLDGKVALLDALDLTRQSMPNTLYIDLLTRAHDAVVRGENVSSALANPALILPSVCDALKSGERNGQMAPVLTSVAQSRSKHARPVMPRRPRPCGTARFGPCAVRKKKGETRDAVGRPRPCGHGGCAAGYDRPAASSSSAFLHAITLGPTVGVGAGSANASESWQTGHSPQV
jgi:type II secretory pathway component PulF